MYGFDSVPSSLINDTPDPSSAKTTRLGAAPCNLDQSVGADGKATQAMVINASANATEPMRVLKMLRSHKAIESEAHVQRIANSKVGRQIWNERFGCGRDQKNYRNPG